MSRSPESAGRHRRSLRARLALSLVTVILTLAVVEGASRLLLRVLDARAGPPVSFAFQDVWTHEGNPFHRPDPELLWKLEPGAERGDIRINSLGFRGPGIARARTPGVRRIALLGNSVTFGFDVPEAETFAALLPRELSPMRVEVVNAGVIGYSSWQIRRYYPRAVRPLHPDLVAIMAGYNDHHSALRSDAEKRGPRGAAALASALVRRMAVHRLISRLRGGRVAPELRRRPVPRVTLDEFEENVRALARDIRRDGAAVVFLTVPLRPGIPLVENFVPVGFEEADGPQTVWLRQVDFALGSVGAEWQPVFKQHFFGNGDLAPFACAPGSLERTRELSERYPDLPIFPYLLGRCLLCRGDTEAAGAAFRRARSLDREREEVESYNRRLRALAARGEWPVLDLAAVFAADPRGGSLFLDAVHPTAAGHALIARSLAVWIEAHGLLR